MLRYLLSLLIAVLCYLPGTAQDEHSPALAPGTAAPLFSAPDTLGQNMALKDFRGSWLVLDFWASWCGDCRREIPDMKRLEAAYRNIDIEGKPLKWLSVSFDDNHENWRKALQKYQMPWPQISDGKAWKKNPIAADYKLKWIPTCYIIDPEGRIVSGVITADALETELVRLTGKRLTLPSPTAERGSDIMTALRHRRSVREYADRPLDGQDIADLLWAAGGRNRDDGRLTSPTAMNRQEILLFLVTAEGCYRYLPEHHVLQHIADGDHRALVASRQEAFAKAPAFIVMVADTQRFGMQGERALCMMSADAGIASENINVFCAAAGLATVTRGTMDSEALIRLFGLDASFKPILNNAVGYPAE